VPAFVDGLANRGAQKFAVKSAYCWNRVAGTDRAAIATALVGFTAVGCFGTLIAKLPE
jgi:hypothetical protein